MSLPRTRPGEGTGSGKQVFSAQRMVSDAIAAGLFASLGLGLFALTLVRGLASQRTGFIWGFGLPMLLLLGGIAVVLVDRYFDRRPILKLSDAGLKARGLQRPLRWEEIQDVEYDERRTRLLVHVPRSASNRKTRQAIPLKRLDRSQRRAAFETVLERVNARRASLGMEETRTARDLREVAEFDRTLSALTPTLWALPAVVALNAGIWLLQVLAGVPVMQPPADVLFRWGGNSASAVLQDGEAWRLLTATFLHGGLLHLAFNMVGLWQPGRQLGRMLGNGPFLLVYLATALCGSAASLHFAAQRSVSVGASGAVFGVLGALVACGWRHREQLPLPHTRQLWSGPGVFIVYALVQGFGSTRVDNAAHVGGLLGGALLGLLLVPRFDREHAGQARMRAVGAAIAAAAIVAGGVLATPAPRVSHRELFEAAALVRQAGPEFERLGRDMQPFRGRDARDPAMRVFLQGQLLPRCAAIQRTLAPVRLPGEPIGQAADRMRRLCALMSEIAHIDLEAFTLEERARGAERIAALQPQMQQLMRELAESKQQQAGRGR